MPIKPKNYRSPQRVRTISKHNNASKRLYGYQWQKRSKAFLANPDNRLCCECNKEGRLTVSTVVDHATPHRGDLSLFWDEDNWQGLCKAHHDRKTRAGL